MQGIPTRILSAAAGLLVVALCAPATLSAQQQLPPEVQEWAIELQELQSQLQPLQEQALQEPEIQAEQASVVEALFETMVASNPETAERIERLEELMQEAQSAQEAGDAERIAQLSAEAAELQPQIQAAQGLADFVAFDRAIGSASKQAIAVELQFTGNALELCGHA